MDVFLQIWMKRYYSFVSLTISIRTEEMVFKRAKKMLKDRFMINKSLHYDWSAYLFSFLMFIMTLTLSIFEEVLVSD